jgi:Cof subfamily protein (haloacid dehalogenase superfamily)
LGVKQPKAKAVLCLDIDGTLTDQDGKIHPRDVAILKDFPSDIQLVIATGRPLSSVRGILNEYGIFPSGPFPLPGIFLNGGIALLPGEKPIVEHFLSPALRDEISLLPGKFTNTTFTFFSDNQTYLINPNTFSRFITARDHLSIREVTSSGLPKKVIKVMVIEEDRNIIDRIKTQIHNLDAEMGTSLPYLFEINPPGINKARTLSELLTLMGLDHLPVYAAGDGENDIATMELADKFYTPSTANEHVQNQADHIIDRQKEGMLAPILAEIY